MTNLNVQELTNKELTMAGGACPINDIYGGLRGYFDIDFGISDFIAGVGSHF